MKHFALWLAILLPACAQHLDGIAVSVGKHIVTLSEVDDFLRATALIDGSPLNLSPGSRRKAAEQLVDQYLILQEAALTRATLPSEASVPAVLQPIKSRYTSEEEWIAALRKANLSEAALRRHLLTGFRLLRYADARFRPEVQVTEESLRKYYDNFVVQAQSPGTKPPSFEDSREQIEQILTNQYANEALERWLEMARKSADIAYREAAFK